MGIIFSNAALLTQAKRNGVRFDEILTIGHQTLYVSPRQLARLAAHHGLQIDPSAFAPRQYADKFFEVFLDARRVQSLDYSDYEACDLQHDMNQPVDPRYHESFDAVIDGGSLEHIFHFPTAIANCMNLVKKGGSLFIFNMANNHLGHGFYQFSPELFFRLFQSGNGYEIRDVILEKHPFPGAELSNRTKCYSVVDPAAVRGRVGLVCRSPVMIMVHAVRTEIRPILAEYPIQSDYQAIYADQAKATGDPRADPSMRAAWLTLAQWLVNRLPTRCRNYLEGRRQLWRYSFFNRRFYRRWYPL